MAVTVLKFVTGPIENNTYLVFNEDKKCVIIDPSSGCDKIIEVIKNESLYVESIFLTHGHFDHFLGIPEIKSSYPEAAVYIHPLEKMMLRDPELNGSVMIGQQIVYDGDTIDFAEGNQTIGSFSLQVIAIKGHSPCGVAIYIEKYLFCGDILFAGSIGRSDLPGGDQDALVEGIRKKLLVLPDDTIVCPGHMGRTTIGREKKVNPFL